VRIEYGQPIRSAITVDGIVGTACSNSRIRGSNTSATHPAAARRYRGGPSAASAAFTVFLQAPITRAISEIDNRSDRRSRRISPVPHAQHLLPPRLETSQGLHA
jgi:hypothetical protein